jgi:hypothetical protein
VDNDLAAVDRHVPHHSPVITVHLRRRGPAHRTRHRHVPGPGRDHHRVAAVRHVLDDQRRKPRKHRPYKEVDIHHKIMIKGGYSASPPTTGQSQTFGVTPDHGRCIDEPVVSSSVARRRPGRVGPCPWMMTVRPWCEGSSTVHQPANVHSFSVTDGATDLPASRGTLDRTDTAQRGERRLAPQPFRVVPHPVVLGLFGGAVVAGGHERAVDDEYGAGAEALPLLERRQRPSVVDDAVGS